MEKIDVDLVIKSGCLEALKRATESQCSKVVHELAQGRPENALCLLSNAVLLVQKTIEIRGAK